MAPAQNAARHPQRVPIAAAKIGAAANPTFPKIPRRPKARPTFVPKAWRSTTSTPDPAG
jgi:hypothetical protein